MARAIRSGCRARTMAASQAKANRANLLYCIAFCAANLRPLYSAVVVQLYRPFTPPAKVMITSWLLLLYN